MRQHRHLFRIASRSQTPHHGILKLTKINWLSLLVQSGFPLRSTAHSCGSFAGSKEQKCTASLGRLGKKSAKSGNSSSRLAGLLAKASLNHDRHCPVLYLNDGQDLFDAEYLRADNRTSPSHSSRLRSCLFQKFSKLVTGFLPRN